MDKRNKKKKENGIKKFYIENFENIRLGLFFGSILLLMLSIVHTCNFEYAIGQFKVRLNNHLNDLIQKPKDDIPDIVIQDKQYHVSLEIEENGYNVYAPVSGKSGYRYGPSIIINEDGSLDAYFAANANNSEWDWITYKHSDDGINWSNEKIILQPSGNSMDHYSVCDPGVIYFNGYYYLGYTSTIIATNKGINNNIYVARSKNPDGPFEKWNGNGWSGLPEPIIYYDESADAWGAGEISFVVANDSLYCYYSWNCEHGSYTKVQVAPLEENWPSKLEYKGIVFENKYGQDSSDVIYIDEYDKFVSFATSERFSANSGVVIYESDDGIDFDYSDVVHTNMSMFAHNMGISKHRDGHVSMNDDLKIGYGFSNSSNSWGRWATRIQDVNLIVYEGTERKSMDSEGEPTYRSNCSTKLENSYLSGIGVSNKSIKLYKGEKYTPSIFGYNQYHKQIDITGDINYEYDQDYISFDGNTLTALKEGKTEIRVENNGLYTSFTVQIFEEGFDPNVKKEIIKFKPREKDILLYLDNKDYHTVQIRAYVEFNNGTWAEAFNDYTSNHRQYKALVDASEYLMEYEVEDNSIVDVSQEGIITPKNEGTTKVFVEITGGLSFEVNVTVKN